VFQYERDGARQAQRLCTIPRPVRIGTFSRLTASRRRARNTLARHNRARLRLAVKRAIPDQEQYRPFGTEENETDRLHDHKLSHLVLDFR